MKLNPGTRRLILGLLFTAPFTIGFVLFTLYPLLSSLYYSFTDYSLLKPPVWVGFGNYYRMFFKDELFWKSPDNSITYTVLSVPMNLVVSFILALALNAKVRGMAIYRTIFFLPTLVPTVALAILWLWIFNAQNGIANAILNMLGLPSLGWLADYNLAIPSLVLMGVWSVGQTVVIFLAGLQDIPQQLYEAAEIDGASNLQKVQHVTIPMMTPVILFSVIIGIIAGFQYFTQAYIMTNGGPANATLFFPLYRYRNGFQYLKMGYASALGWILFLLILACTLVVVRTSRRWVYYGGVR